MPMLAMYGSFLALHPTLTYIALAHNAMQQIPASHEPGGAVTQPAVSHSIQQTWVSDNVFSRG